MKKLLVSMIVLSFTGLSLAADYGTLSCFPPSGTGYNIGWVENGGTFTTTATTLYVAESSGYLPTCVGYRDPNGVSNYQLSADIQFGSANEYGLMARGTLTFPTVAKGYYCAFNADSGYFNIVKIVNGLANPPVKDTDFFNLADEATGYSLDPNNPNVKIVFNVYTVGSLVVLDGRLYDSTGALIKSLYVVDDGTVGGAVLTGDDYGTYCGKTGDDPINATYTNMAINAITPYTLTSTVTLQDWTAGTSGVAVNVQVQDQADDSIITFDTTLDPNGVFALPLTNGSYKVRVKAAHWLSDIQNVTISGANQTASFSLVNGDVDGDNEVTSLEANFVDGLIGKTPSDPEWDPSADVDGDLEVTSLDYNITNGNVGLVGDDF